MARKKSRLRLNQKKRSICTKTTISTEKVKIQKEASVSYVQAKVEVNASK